MADITLVQGDTAPDLLAVITEEGSDTPVDLTGAQVVFQMRKPDDRRYTVNAACAVTDATHGVVRYEWGPNDLAVIGEYQAQFEVTYLDLKIQTTRQTFSIEVRRQ